MNLSMDLKNIQISDIKDKLIAYLEGLKDPKIAKKFIVYFASVIVFLIVYYVFIKPVADAQKLKINQMNEYRSKITEYSNNISSLRTQVEKIKPQYEKNTKLFHSKKEVEQLYQDVSNYALVNGLTILNLKKSDASAVSGGGNNNNANANKGVASVLYYKIPVNYQISGNFIGYLKFRQSLSKSNKHINFDKEKITIVQKNSSGAIVAEGTISIVGLPNEFK